MAEPRYILMSEELFTSLMEGPIRAFIEKEGKVPVVDFGEPKTEEVTFYVPLITLKTAHGWDEL